ncbi:SRPBCC family protein [Aliiglaciecola sp. CAU 1673]|uniref:SRPBCC family protein n=1 Tax=Aliiglaciecola sp. CAU 1673 TaxID=3032595 RepID=UPI0023DCDF01|nr:SRPBCC family protein [Aliiglaciecola sp. CAU 1673]MDF2179907.1 SRPBCC family protein [Aliiglaciecola sp. CAU 1673]
MEQIQIRQAFNAPVKQVFNTLCDHETFGKIIGARINRIKDGEDGHTNGLGSIRRIAMLPGVYFEETVVSFVPYQLMEYLVSKGSPVKNHLGRMVFEEKDGVTTLNYSIRFEPKLPLPGFGKLLKPLIAGPIVKGLKKLADGYST